MLKLTLGILSCLCIAEVARGYSEHSHHAESVFELSALDTLGDDMTSGLEDDIPSDGFTRQKRSSLRRWCCQGMPNHGNMVMSKCIDEIKEKQGKAKEDEIDRQWFRENNNCIKECMYKEEGWIDEGGVFQEEKYKQIFTETYSEEPWASAANHTLGECLSPTEKVKTNTISEDKCSSKAAKISRCTFCKMMKSCPNDRRVLDDENCKKMFERVEKKC